MKTLIAALALAAATVTVTAPAMAQPQTDFRQHGGGWGNGGLNLSGLRVDAAKQQLSYAGYSPARSIKLSGQQYDLWSSGRGRDSCVGFTSRNGTVTDVRNFDDSDCGNYNDGGWGGGGWGGGNDRFDLEGQSVKGAQSTLRSRGFNPARSIKLSGQQWDLWQSDRGRDCVGFTSYKGRVTDSRSFRNNECGGGGGWGNDNGGWNGYGGAVGRLVGLSVRSAQDSLANEGFRKARSINLRGQQWDLWYDDRGRGGRCVGFTSYNGRVSDADTFDRDDCY